LAKKFMWLFFCPAWYISTEQFYYTLELLKLGRPNYPGRFKTEFSPEDRVVGSVFYFVCVFS